MSAKAPLEFPGRKVHGLDIDLSGRILPRLHATLGLSLVRARDVRGENGVEMQISEELPARGMPARTLSLLAPHDLAGHDSGTARLGLGLRAYSSSLAVGPYDEQVVPDHELRLPGGSQLDLSWERRLGMWTIAAAVNNVFNRQLYDTQAEPDYIPLLPKRSLRLTATFKD